MSRCRSREWHRAHRGRPCRRHLPLAGATPTAGPNPADRVLLRGLPACSSWTLGARRWLLAVAVAGPAHQCGIGRQYYVSHRYDHKIKDLVIVSLPEKAVG